MAPRARSSSQGGVCAEGSPPAAEEERTRAAAREEAVRGAARVKAEFEAPPSEWPPMRSLAPG